MILPRSIKASSMKNIGSNNCSHIEYEVFKNY